MKKINLKSIIVIVILLLVGVLGVLGINTARTYLSGASGAAEPKAVKAEPGEDGRSAIISWTSDKPSMGIVEYGTTPASLLLRAIESTEVSSHQVSLAPLKPNVNYYYRIRVGEDIFDNNGIPYSFKTGEGTGEMVQEMPQGEQMMPTEMPQSQPPPAGVVCQSGVDYNNDGKINSLDMIECRKQNPQSASAPTSFPEATTAPANPDGACKSGVDYNNDGKINSLDMVKCLQDNG
jgi:hypothetical protein